MKPEETIDFHIRWVWAKISRLYNQEAASYGSTMSVGYILLNIDKEGTHSTKLGPKMGMEPRSLTRTLKTMEELGLIYREDDPSDGRMVLIFLTKKGVEMRDRAATVVRRFNEYVREVMTPERVDVFLDVIQEMNNKLDNPDIFENTND